MCVIGRDAASPFAQFSCLTINVRHGIVGDMKNITIKLDAEQLRRVRHIAVDEETSVSGWVSRLIETELHNRDAYELAREKALADLETPLSLGGQPLTREEVHRR